MDIGLKALKTEIRETLVESLKLSAIRTIFLESGFTIINETVYDTSTRRGLVEAYYKSHDWEKEETIKKFFKVIKIVLNTYYISLEQREAVRSFCKESGFIIDENDNINYDKLNFSKNLFKKQFPLGLPFGKYKPDYSIQAIHQSQNFKCEWKTGTGVIENNVDVYPNFTYPKLASCLKCDIDDDTLIKCLKAMNQTKHEKDFFWEYGKFSQFRKNYAPILIPQAWIQWHSLSKDKLKSTHPLKYDIHRIDFVAFWNNKRFAIPVDGSSHYCDEESYSKTLKEDRDLHKKGWEVFRISNWDIEKRVNDILEELKEFIGF